MFRSRSSRSVVATAASVVLILGLMAGTTSAKKPTPTPTPTPTATPTPNSDNRKVYLGDIEGFQDGSGNGHLVPTPVTVGGIFRFDVRAQNTGAQNLTHALLAVGEAIAPNADTTKTVLPDGVQILRVDSSLDACNYAGPATRTYSCDVGSLTAGSWITAVFTLKANSEVSAKSLAASIKVAENVNDQGANRNTFFASKVLTVLATDSDHNGTYIEGPPFELGTAGQLGADTDLHVTTVKAGPGGTSAGFISIVESNATGGCLAAERCIGQLVTLNVNDGAAVQPYLEWILVIKDVNVVASKGGVVHDPDGEAASYDILNTRAWSCDRKAVPCMVSYDVNKSSGETTIVFRTAGNGAVRAH